MKSFVIATVIVLCACAFSTKSAQAAYAGHVALEVLQETPYLPVADVMPEPVGGLGAIAKRLVYPELAKKAGVEGKVYLIAYINENGDVDDVKVIKGLPGGCEEAAIKAVKDSHFTAGKQNGTPVKVQLSLPISFRLK